MIIFGTRSTSIGEAQAKSKCSHCQSENTVWIYIYRHYFHIFWIPTFPLWSSVASHCTHCKQVLTKNGFDLNLKSAHNNAKLNAKTPLWTFSLLIGLAVLIILGIILAQFGNK